MAKRGSRGKQSLMCREGVLSSILPSPGGLSLPLSALVISRSWGSRTCICFTTMVLSNTCTGGKTCVSETQSIHHNKKTGKIWKICQNGGRNICRKKKILLAQNRRIGWMALTSIGQSWIRAWNVDNIIIIIMLAVGLGILLSAVLNGYGWVYFRGHGEISIRSDLTIQQHDPRCVGGSQQRLTPGVRAHDLIGECAAERLRLPWLQHTSTYTHGDKHRDTHTGINIHLIWQNI